MSRKIIGQCNIADFRQLQHLSVLMNRGEEIDLSNLTNREKVAVNVVRHFRNCGVPFKVLLRIREVLVWEMPDKGLAFEYKLLVRGDKETHAILRAMTPRRVENGRS